MKLKLADFELSKLAREKGFTHMKADCYGDNMCYQLPDGELTNALRGNTVTGYVLAPTLSLLQKWLRDVHKIHVSVFIYNDEEASQTLWYNEIIDVKDDWNTFGDNTYYHSYEEALEAGLLEALKLIEYYERTNY